MFQNIKPILSKRNTILAIAGIIVGAGGGFIYYYFVGCRTGTCAITSNPWISTLWGAAVGYLVFDMFSKKKSVESVKDDSRS